MKIMSVEAFHVVYATSYINLSVPVWWNWWQPALRSYCENCTDA